MDETKLIKPLFHDGNFNADGKRMKAVFVREVSNDTNTFRLWRGYGTPDRSYPRAENDTHILHVEAGDYLAPLGVTEYDMVIRCGEPLAFAELYGGKNGREKHFDALRQSGEVGGESISRALEKEDEAIRRLGSIPVHQAGFVKAVMDRHISTYLAAKENGGESFPDFIGAAVLDELALCRELSVKYKAKRRAEDLAWQAKVKAEEKKRREETNLQAKEQMQQALHVLRCGCVLHNDCIQFYREDGGFGKYSIVNHLMRRYGVDVPLRTQGWINDKLVSFTVENGRCENLRYMRTKNGRCSQKFFECVNALIQKVKAETEAAA